jgi:hypothetical protein
MNVPQYLYGTNEDIQRYFALLIQAIQKDLSNNGFVLPPQSAANVTVITGFTFQPVLEPGTQWFNSTLKKMQFITNAAVPATATNATIETITSA